MADSPIICRACDKRPAVCVPVIEVPILRWPIPLRMQFQGGLCNACAYVFDLNKWTDYDGCWYDLACDQLKQYNRMATRPAVNPFPENSDFKWDEWLLNPNYEPGAKESCVLKFWDIRSLQATKAEVNLQTRKVTLSK